MQNDANIALMKEAAPIETSDPVLSSYLDAVDSAEADKALQRLLECEATPVIESVLRRKTAAIQETEDIISTARAQLIEQLLSLRAGGRAPIARFKNYAASVAFTAWAEYLRARNPRRSMLLNRLRYLLENRTNRRGFIVREGLAGEKWCGLVAWPSESNPPSTPRLQWFMADAKAAARDIFGRRNWRAFDLAALVTEIFGWLGHPIELRDLVSAIAELLDVSDRAEPLEEASERDFDDQFGNSPGSPSEEAVWKEYLLWLWQAIERLSPSQCAAFLLGSSVLRDFELLGVASVRSLAPRFAIVPEDLAALWQRLPLDDLAIASELKCTRQQVINLRRVARDNLGRAWREFSADPNTGGNKIPDSTSSNMKPAFNQ